MLATATLRAEEVYAMVTCQIKHWNQFKIISATLNVLENIHELQQASEIFWNNFRQNYFSRDDDEGWNNFISHVTMALLYK